MRRSRVRLLPPAPPASERIVDPAEYRRLLAAESDVDVADDEWAGDEAKTHAAGDVQMGERVGSHRREHPPGIDERRELEREVGAEEMEGVDGETRLGARLEAVAVDEAPIAERAQWLRAAGNAAIAAEVRQVPERRLRVRRHVAEGRVADEGRV